MNEIVASHIESKTGVRRASLPTIIKLLHVEITRLNTERTELVLQKSDIITRINEIDLRLGAAESMLTTYKTTTIDSSPNDLIEDFDTVDIPLTLKGRRLHPHSKKAQIIRATKALLQANGGADRGEIVQFLSQLGIMSGEKNPKAYLSVILCYADEIFESNDSIWTLREIATELQLASSRPKKPSVNSAI